MSQVAFDRFVVELPPPEPGYTPLTDPEEGGRLVRWLWEFGRTPVLALVGGDPKLRGQWATRRVSWTPDDADAGGTEIAWRPDGGSLAVVLEHEADLDRFLTECPAISRVALLWPRIDLAKSFMKLSENGDWRPAAEAVARLSAAGSHVEVRQLA